MQNKPTKQTFVIRPGNTAFDSFLHVYSERDTEKEWKITFEPYKKNRTLAQNALMWMWHTYHIKHGTQGGTKNSCHHEFKRKYILPVLLEKNENEEWQALYEYACTDARIMELFIDGKVSTTQLTTKELSGALTEYDRDVAEEEQVILPHPGDIYNEAMGVKDVG